MLQQLYGQVSGFVGNAAGFQNPDLLGVAVGLLPAAGFIGASASARAVSGAAGLGAKVTAKAAEFAGKAEWKDSLNQTGDALINFATKNIKRDAKIAAALTVVAVPFIANAGANAVTGFFTAPEQSIFQRWGVTSPSLSGYGNLCKNVTESASGWTSYLKQSIIG